MSFDYKKAKADGFSDEDIAQHLSQKTGFKYEAAIEDGFKPVDIVNKLITSDLSKGSSTQEDFGGPDRPGTAPKPGQAERMRDLGRKVPAALGATAMVAAAGTGVGLLPAVGLAALGGAGGEAWRQNAERLSDDPVDVAATPGEAVKDLAAAGGEQAAYELAPRVLIKGIGKALAPFKDKLTEGAVAVGKKLKEAGSSLTATQMTDSRTLDLVDSMARGSFFGSGTMLVKEAEQAGALKKMGEKVSKNFSDELSTRMSDNEAGELFVDTVKQGRTAFKAAAEKMYRTVDGLVDEAVTKSGKLVSKSKGTFKQAAVATTALKNRANELAAEFKRVADVGKTDAAGGLIKQVQKLSDRIGFGDAQLLRSNLLAMGRDLDNFGADSKAKAIVSDMAATTTRMIEEAAGSLPPNALKAWKEANKFYRFGTKYFDNDFITKLALSGKVPWERVGEKVFATGNVEQVVNARRSLRVAEQMQKKAGNVAFNFKDAWRGMQSGFYENQVLLPATKDGVVNGEALLRRINDPKLGRTMKAAFTSEQLAAVKDFAQTAKFVQKKTESGAGMVMQMAQGGALINLAALPFVAMTGGDVAQVASKAMAGTGGAVFIAPRVMAEMLTNPKTIKWLTEGIKLPAGTEIGTTTGARIIAAANDIYTRIQREEFDKRRAAKGVPERE